MPVEPDPGVEKDPVALFVEHVRTSRAQVLAGTYGELLARNGFPVDAAIAAVLDLNTLPEESAWPQS